MPTARPAAAGLSLRSAGRADVPALVALINAAYRGQSSRQGWTTEADLLDGQRTDAAALAELLAADDSLILVCERDGQLLGSAHLRRHGDEVRLGLFTVRPGWQGQGIGSAFLAAAEAVARERLGARRLGMQVITRRDELIDYYQRRGYRRTGRQDPFPADPRYGIPRVAALRLEYLEKTLAD